MENLEDCAGLIADLPLYQAEQYGIWDESSGAHTYTQRPESYGVWGEGMDGNIYWYVDMYSLYLEELDREIQTAKESIPGKQRLCRSLGILGGLFLVLLLI